MGTTPCTTVLDPLYGRVVLDNAMSDLLQTPTLQRLRHVRLSNIDSTDMPSVANLSRYEHVIGVCHLSGLVGFRNRLGRLDNLALRSAALLHDWAITSFGHLVEEALQYVGTRFDHEDKLRRVLLPGGDGEIGGADLQIFSGRNSGLGPWAHRVAGPEARTLLETIMRLIRGDGAFGAAVAGTIDLDNVDNVFRMAFHMGFNVDRSDPARLAKSMVGTNETDGRLVFRSNSVAAIERWRRTRREVYEHLMLSEGDFTGKLMMLYATVEAFRAGEITEEAWSLVDYEFVAKLISSPTEAVAETVRRWLTGERWNCIPLHWMEGDRPDYPDLLAFAEDLPSLVDRTCFAYAIKDKRDRHLVVSFDDGTQRSFGENPRRWLLGIGGPKKADFSPSDVRRLVQAAERRFSSRSLGRAVVNGGETQESLF